MIYVMSLIEEYIKSRDAEVDSEKCIERYGIIMGNVVEDITVYINLFSASYNTDRLLKFIEMENFEGLIFLSEREDFSEVEKGISNVTANNRRQEIDIYRIPRGSEYAEKWICKPKKYRLNCEYEFKEKIPLEDLF